MRTRCSSPILSSRNAFPQRSTLAASSPYVTLVPWQRIATADSRTPRCESMNVSAALYRAGSSVSRGSPTWRIMSPPDASRRGELHVRIHHLRMLALQPAAQTREEPFSLPGGDVVPHRDAREYEELLRAHLDRPEVDDLVYSRLARDRGAELLDDFLGGSLADDEPARAPRELIRDIDKDGADHRAGNRIEAVIVRQHGEAQSHDRSEQARQCRAVFVEDRAQGRVAKLLQEPAHRHALLARGVPDLAHRDAQGEGLEDHREPKDNEADPHRAELLRMRQTLVRLVHRDDA